VLRSNQLSYLAEWERKYNFLSLNSQNLLKIVLKYFNTANSSKLSVMKLILVLAFLSGLLFLFAVICLIVGLFRDHKGLKWIGIITLSISLLSGGASIYNLVVKVKQISKPRTGEEIYAALFGKPASNCVKVLHYQDQVVPKIDYAIWLHFKTCPDEMKRILSQHNYEFEKISGQDSHNNGPSANNNWFKPEQLGDSVLSFKFKKDEYGNVQTIYLNRDSTEAYCIDVMD
jgi:hypothetical protein